MQSSPFPIDVSYFYARAAFLLAFLEMTLQLCKMVLQQSLLGELVKNLRELQCGSHCFHQEVEPEKSSWLHLPLSCCHLPLQKGEGKRVGRRNFELQGEIFSTETWQVFLTWEKGKKKQYISYKTSFIKIFELVIAVAQEQGVSSGHSCLNASLKLSWRTWTQIPKLH